jgi:tRNA G18 (ribose-2'-O)-methylase SpoU
MARWLIDDLNDPRIAIYRDLKTSNRTRRLDQFVVEGEKLFDRLRESPFPIVSVLASDRNSARIANRVPAGVPLYVVPHQSISLLVGFNFHRGILACGERRSWPDLATIAAGRSEERTLIICPRLENPENLGAIVRIGDVFGVDAVLVGGRCPDPLSRRVLRVSMGTALRLPVLASDDLAQDLDRLGGALGFKLVASLVDPSAESLRDFRRPDRLALLLGSEGDGLEPEWIARCQRKVTIPMRPGAESLNVAVAAGILLYHLTRTQPRTT